MHGTPYVQPLHHKQPYYRTWIIASSGVGPRTTTTTCSSRGQHRVPHLSVPKHWLWGWSGSGHRLSTDARVSTQGYLAGYQVQHAPWAGPLCCKHCPQLQVQPTCGRQHKPWSGVSPQCMWAGPSGAACGTVGWHGVHTVCSTQPDRPVHWLQHRPIQTGPRASAQSWSSMHIPRE